MHIVRHGEAPPYEAPGHAAMAMRRLQGREAGPADQLWLGMSEIAPGGGTTLDASPVEKFYLVLDGAVDVSNGAESVVLERWDSCRIAPGEARRLTNTTERPATILLVMPLRPPAPADAARGGRAHAGDGPTDAPHPDDRRHDDGAPRPS